MRKILSEVHYVAPKDTDVQMWEESELISAVQNFLLGKRYVLCAL